MTRTEKALSICLNLAFAASPAVAAEQHYYLEYDTFRALTALVPEAPEPRLINLPDGGYELWSQGQMRLPAGDNLVAGDFNQDGHPDAALIFRSHGRRYLLIASQIQGRWVRQALIELKEQSGVTLNGSILILGPPETFVAWDGHRYRLATKAPAPAPAVDQSLTKDSPRRKALEQPPTAFSATVLVPIRFFAGIPQQELHAVEIRLSYRGPSTESLPDLRFVAEGSDHTGGEVFRVIAVPVLLLQRLLEALQEPFASLVPDAEPKPFPWLSVVVETHAKGPTKTFQASLNSADAKGIFLIFQQILKGDRLARHSLQFWGCAIDLLPPGQATDVTDHVNITINTSYRSPWDRASKLPQTGRAAPSDVRVRVTNRSGSPLTGPISIVFNLSGNARVLEPDGTTCHTTPVGREYVQLSLRANRLLAGETVETPVRIENPEQVPITFDVKVLGGPATR